MSLWSLSLYNEPNRQRRLFTGSFICWWGLSGYRIDINQALFNRVLELFTSSPPRQCHRLLLGLCLGQKKLWANLTNNDNPPDSSGQQPRPMPLWLDFLWCGAKFVTTSVAVIDAMIMSDHLIPILIGVPITIWSMFKYTMGSKRRY